MGVHLLRLRTSAAAAALLLGASWAACDASPPDPTDDPATAMVSGRYRVKGLTTDPTSPHERKISGSVILVQDGAQYTATYEFKTTFPAEGGFANAEVVGVGQGAVDGSTLTGTAHTQLVISAVPGVDTGFAFVPRIVTTRIVSNSVARIRPDGTIVIEIENRAEPGQDYRPTRTRLTGRRVSDDTTPPVGVR